MNRALEVEREVAEELDKQIEELDRRIEQITAARERCQMGDEEDARKQQKMKCLKYEIQRLMAKNGVAQK